MSRTLFISDLHLSETRPALVERFHDFLREQAPGAAGLYILGDLFDYWVGDDTLDDPEGDPLASSAVAGLARVARAGTPVYFMRGNRDFLIGERFAAAAGLRLLDDPTVADLGGAQTLLMHGDTLCTDDVDYQAWRATCRAPAWQRAMLAKPLAERRGEVLALRARSSAAVKAKPPEIMDATPAAVVEALRRHACPRLIHGHTHRPGQHTLDVDGRRCERWVLPDWYERGGYLELDARGARLKGW